MIRNAVLRPVIRADLLAAVARAHHALARSGNGCLLLGKFCLVQARSQDLHGLLFVLQLRAFVLALHNNARRNMDKADSGFNLIDVLSALAARPENIDTQVGIVDLDINILGFGQYGYGSRRRVDATTGLGLGHALHTVHTTFVLQHAVGLVAFDAEGDLLVPAALALGEIDHIDAPALGFAEPLIHTEQIACEQSGFVAAGACTYLDDAAFIVVRIARNQLIPQCVIQLLQLFFQRMRILEGHIAHLGVGRWIVDQLAVFGDTPLHVQVGSDRGNDRTQLLVLARYLAQQAHVVRNGRVVQGMFDRRKAVQDGEQAFLHTVERKNIADCRSLRSWFFNVCKPHVQLRSAFIVCCLAATIVSCASEDPNILDPSPSTMNIQLRFINAVADGTPRSLVLERDVVSDVVPYAQFAATVSAPLDSSRIIVDGNGIAEFTSTNRITFIRNAVANIVATGTGPADSAIVQTVILPLTGAAVASIRVSNMVADTTTTYDVRKGCPSGPSITPTPLRYRATSLYADVVPGSSVFSILERSGATERTVAIIECTLAPYRPYQLMVLKGGNDEPQLLLLEETDTTQGAARPITTVTERVADVRVINTTTSAAGVRLDATGQDVTTNLAPMSVSSYTSIPTCVSLAQDRFTVTLADGRTVQDSTIVSVRRKSSILLADDGQGVRSIVVPPSEGVVPDGKARIRVVHANATERPVVVSVGGRTDATSANGINAGLTLASNLSFGSISAPLDIPAGALPLTVTSATTPTRMLHVTADNVASGAEYVLVLAPASTGFQTFLLPIDDQGGALRPTSQAAFLRFVNGMPGTEAPRVDIVPALRDGQVYYRNSVATSVPIGGTEIRIDGTEESVPTADGERTLVILTDRRGQRDMVTVVSPPLAVVPKQSERRVINATKDVDFVSVAYDSIPKRTPLAPKLAERVGYGEVSRVDRTTVDRRGTYYVYDDDGVAFTELYKLPMSFTPLGNSATLIVVGSKETGYDVIVLQEF